MNVKAQLAILMVFVGCGSNVIFLELMINEDPGSGNLITFSQFLVIALEGFIVTTRFLTVKPKVPFTAWLTLVVMFFLVRFVFKRYSLIKEVNNIMSIYLVYPTIMR